MSIWGLAIFAGGSLALALISRASLRAPRSHGFYRFLAWEAILALAVLQASTWFADLFSWHQIISWCLLSVSLFLVVEGLRLLRRLGEPDPQRAEEPLLALEKTTRLVTTGVYRHIRHPLYSSLLFLAWGIFFKDPGWLAGALAAATTLCLVVTARIEEAENLRFFGPEYGEYMQRTKLFIPFLF